MYGKTSKIRFGLALSHLLLFGASSSNFRFSRFGPIFQLQAAKKIAQNLIFAEPIVVLARFAEKSGYLMLADSEPRQSHDFLDVITLQIQGYPEFFKNAVVGQTLLRFRWRPFYFSSFLNNQPVEK